MVVDKNLGTSYSFGGQRNRKRFPYTLNKLLLELANMLQEQLLLGTVRGALGAWTQTIRFVPLAPYDLLRKLGGLRGIVFHSTRKEPKRVRYRQTETLKCVVVHVPRVLRGPVSEKEDDNGDTNAVSARVSACAQRTMSAWRCRSSRRALGFGPEHEYTSMQPETKLQTLQTKQNGCTTNKSSPPLHVVKTKLSNRDPQKT